jgi:hypothetical protein
VNGEREAEPKRKDLPKNQRGVALAWKHGYSMRSGHMRTDGDKVWSWHLCIGLTVRGEKVAIDYREQISASTSRHCGDVILAADRVEEPEVPHG